MIDDSKSNKTDLKLVSTEPVCDEKQYGVYADILDQKIKAKSVFNIGIIAPYGAGKSSLIKTYKEKRLNCCQRKRVTTISLANFNTDDDKTKNETSKDNEKNSKTVNKKNETSQIKDIESEIEKSILEQIIFKENKAKLPHSNCSNFICSTITRCHRNNLRYSCS